MKDTISNLPKAQDIGVIKRKTRQKKLNGKQSLEIIIINNGI